MYRNHEGYPDPTAGIAVERITQEEHMLEEWEKLRKRNTSKRKRAHNRRKKVRTRQTCPSQIRWIKAWPKDNG